MPDQPTPWLTVPQACAYCGYSPRWLRQRLREGVIPGRKIGAHWRIHREELEGWLWASTG
jgi:excisionase family DNA binding protein